MPQNQTAVILIVLGLVVLGAVAYLLFGQGQTDPAVLITDTAITERELVFVNLTAQIEPIKFETGILTDPRFLALVDLSTAIVPENTGRTDPFAPIPGVSP
jgi:hypothetical protein